MNGDNVGTCRKCGHNYIMRGYDERNKDGVLVFHPTGHEDLCGACAREEQEGEPRLVSVEEQRELIPDDAVKAAFLERPGIAALPEEEKERRWQEHAKALGKFREFLAGTPAYVVP